MTKRTVLAAGVLGVCAGFGGALRTTEPGGMYLDGAEVALAAAGDAEAVVTDAFGNDVRRGRAAGGRLVLGVLPKGYYTARTAGADGTTNVCAFGVVADPARRVRDAESPYAIDAALAAIVRTSPCGDYVKSVDWYVEALRRAGVVNVRDRFHQQLDRDGNWQPEHYGVPVAAYARAGLRVSETMHRYAPSRCLKGSLEPRSLVEVYDFARAQAEKYPEVAIWEFWNETELPGFWDGSAWGAAAALKAASLGWKDGNAACLVTQPSYCQPPFSQNGFARLLLANGGAEYFDLYNIHLYCGLAGYRGIIDDLARMFRTNGVDGVRVIVSETGLMNEGQGLAAGTGGLRVHSAAQEMLGAEFYPKQQIVLQHLGMAGSYAFCLPAYHEQGGRKDWGMMRADGTAKPGLVAFAALTENLTGCACLGRAELGAGVTGYVYRRPDGRTTLAYWSVSRLDGVTAHDMVKYDGALLERPFTVAADGAAVALADVFGTPGTAACAEGAARLTATRFVRYATGALKVPVAEAARPAGAPNARPAADTFERRVILRVFAGAGTALRADRMSLGVDAAATNRTLALEITNLADAPRRGTLTADAAWARLPAEVEVPARGTARVEIPVPADVPPGYRAVRIAGVFGGRPVTPLVFNLGVRAPGEAAPLPKWDAPEAWRKNSSATSETISYDMQAAALRVDTEYPEGVDRWVYPYYKFPEGPLPKSAGELRFKVKVARVPGKEGKRRRGIVMLNGRDAEGRKVKHWPEFRYFPDGEWRDAEVDFSSIEGDRIDSLQIGLNPQEDTSTFWIKDVRVIR